MGWLQGLKFTAICLALAVVATTVLMVAFTIRPSNQYYQNVRDSMTVAVLLLGIVCFAVAWRRRLDPIGEALGLFGLFLLVLMGYVDPQPTAWEVLPAFLLPWALLVVELPNRHRIVLLAVQWLASAMLLEVWAGTIATTVLFGLALAHVVAVWATLPDGPLRRVPVAVGVVIAATTVGTALWFIVVEPTVRRFAFLTICVALLVAFAYLVRSGRLRGLRVPTLVRAA